MEKLLSVIKEFCEISGEVLNPNKSQIFFSKRASDKRKKETLEITSFIESQLPTKYLGAPLIQGRIKAQYFVYLLENLSSKICGWMRNLLSMSGRLTLIQSVLSSMSIHVMSVLPVPKKILKKMQSVIANFLWDQGSIKKHHWVNNETVCKSKQEGGLGVPNLIDNMKSLHGKLAWNFLEQRSLWARYAKSRFSDGKKGSPIWNAISNHITYLRNKSYWEVGNGDEKIEKFLWHMDRPITSEFAGWSIKDVMMHRPLRFKFLCMVPDEAKNYYKDVVFEAKDSNLRWLESNNGAFTSKKYLQVRRKMSPKLIWGNNIWQQWLPPRFSMLVWRIIHRGLPLDEKIRKLGFYMVSRCSCCLKDEETFQHLFLEGKWATNLWTLLANIFNCQRPMTMENFIEGWLNNYESKKAESSLRMGLACVGVHYVWRLRNNHRHEEPSVFDSNEVIKWAGYLVNLIPKGNADSAAFRNILIHLRIPFNIRSTLEGRWAVWEPDKWGLTMDVAISEECAASAMLIRTNKGEVVGADSIQITPTKNAKDLDRVINIWRSRAGHEVSTILYSHHFSYTEVTHQWSRGVRVKKVHPLVLRAAMSLCYKHGKNNLVTNYACLPLATQKLIYQDRTKLRSFCPQEDEVNDTKRNVQAGVYSDDNLNTRYAIPRLFNDDTNI